MLPIAIALALATCHTPLAVEPDYALAPADATRFAGLEPMTAAAAEGESDGYDFSYTYVEVGGRQLDVDAVDETADIYYGRASLSLLGFLYVFASYENQSVDFQDTSTDLWNLGVGAHMNLRPKLDLFAEVAWLYSDLSTDVANIDETTDGYRVFGGARWMVLPWSGGGLELNGGVGYTDLENRLASDDTASEWELGARGHFMKFLSVGLTYTGLEDDDMLSVDARFSF